MSEEINKRVDRIERHLGINHDYDEDEYLKDAQLCWTKEEWEIYNDERREEELGREIEMAESCTCGAWYVSKRGKVVHIADCCCGNGL